jgi:6-phosphofructokinase 1
LAAEVSRREHEGAKTTMIVVAEGASPKDGRQMRHQTASGEHRLGGVGDLVAREVGDRTGKEVRTCVLGHLQRGGAPTTLDRILGTRFGVKAIQLVEEGKFGTMVSYQNDLTLEVPISHAVHKLRRVKPDCQIVKTARAVEIAFGD